MARKKEVDPEKNVGFTAWLTPHQLAFIDGVDRLRARALRKCVKRYEILLNDGLAEIQAKLTREDVVDLFKLGFERMGESWENLPPDIFCMLLFRNAEPETDILRQKVATFSRTAIVALFDRVERYNREIVRGTLPRLAVDKLMPIDQKTISPSTSS